MEYNFGSTFSLKELLSILIENKRTKSLKMNFLISKKLSLIWIILLSFILAIAINYSEIVLVEITAFEFFKLGIYFIVLFSIAFLIVSALSFKPQNQYALGLPQGSVRAIIAILLILSFLFLALFILYIQLDEHFQNVETEFIEKITNTLGTLVISVSSFYFGSRVTGQATNSTMKQLNTVLKQGTQSEGIRSIDLFQALQENRANWIKKYNAFDITIGYKTIDGKQSTEPCLIFTVDLSNTAVPDRIQYVKKDGKIIKIPTEVNFKTQ